MGVHGNTTLPIYRYFGLQSWRRLPNKSCCCLFRFNVAFDNVLVIPRRSLKYHAPDTCHDATSSHGILTLSRPVLSLPRKSECQARVRSEEQLVPFLTTLVCRGPGSNRSPKRTLYQMSYILINVFE